MESKKPDHCNQHQETTDGKERLRIHLPQNKRTRETACRTENEIKARSKCGVIQSHAQTFHQDFRSSGIRTDINSHMAHDADERKQKERLAQQSQTLAERGRFSLLFLFGDLRLSQQ